MSKIQSTFKRVELKYMVTMEQKEALMQEMQKYMRPDEYGKSTICNIYFDTPDMRLIRHSIEKPVYKEKLRVRSYGMVTANDKVFVELKKKYKSIVYKRRTDMTETEAVQYLCCGGQAPKPGQITNEIDYFISAYEGIAPMAFIAYKRMAFYGKDDPNLRITFDENIVWRDTELSLTAGVFGNPLLLPDQNLLEIKIAWSMPLWLSQKLNELGIYKISFSKYGNAYKTMMNGKVERKMHYA